MDEILFSVESIENLSSFEDVRSIFSGPFIINCRQFQNQINLKRCLPSLSAITKHHSSYWLWYVFKSHVSHMHKTETQRCLDEYQLSWFWVHVDTGIEVSEDPIFGIYKTYHNFMHGMFEKVSVIRTNRNKLKTISWAGKVIDIFHLRFFVEFQIFRASRLVFFIWMTVRTHLGQIIFIYLKKYVEKDSVDEQPSLWKPESVNQHAMYANDSTHG